MDFKKQTKDIKIVTITKPRTYLKWFNTEPGRDKIDCYERIDFPMIHYINTNNPSQIFCAPDAFFKTLEDMYQETLLKRK